MFMPHAERARANIVTPQGLIADSVAMRLRAQNTNIKQAMALFATVLFLLLFSRAVFAFPILFAHNRWSKDPLTLREVVVAWHAPN